MTSDHDMLWSRCAHLGRILLPLVDQEAWRQTRRHEHLGAWGINIAEGERLMEVFAALTAHAVAADTSVSAALLPAVVPGHTGWAGGLRSYHRWSASSWAASEMSTGSLLARPRGWAPSGRVAAGSANPAGNVHRGPAQDSLYSRVVLLPQLTCSGHLE